MAPSLQRSFPLCKIALGPIKDAHKGDAAEGLHFFVHKPERGIATLVVHLHHSLRMQAEGRLLAHTTDMRWRALTVKRPCGALMSQGFCAGDLQICVCCNKRASGYDAACSKALQAVMQQRSPPASMVVFMPGAMQVSQA